MGSAEENRTYIAIDLKSFYASVECVERGLDPLHTNLVVADSTRTEKTICLAVSPSLKAYGIPGRPRLFEVVSRVNEVNAIRRMKAPGCELTGAAFDSGELETDPSLALDYIVAMPQMSKYMDISSKIFGIYLKFVAPEDMHVYSVDEVFIDATEYLKFYGMNAHDFAMTMVRRVLKETGITATAGIGTNLYLCKIAMDIVAKHMPPDADGVRIAQLDEMSYRHLLWEHRPLTDFWRIGHGISRKLEEHGLYTMGDIARCSIGKSGDFYNEDLLYRLFGINARLLIDHAWGYEPCTISDIKACRPESRSLSSGQVLPEPYEYDKGRLIVKEMTDLLVLDLVEKRLVTDQMVLTVVYDVTNLTDPVRAAAIKGEIEKDHYGRPIPKSAHGSINLGGFTSSTRIILDAVTQLYERITDPQLLIRRVYVVANHVLTEDDCAAKQEDVYEQMNLFTDYEAIEREKAEEKRRLEKEKKLQNAMIDLKHRFGKNAVLKGMNLEEGGTTIVRNAQVGGHNAVSREKTKEKEEGEHGEHGRKI